MIMDCLLGAPDGGRGGGGVETSLSATNTLFTLSSRSLPALKNWKLPSKTLGNVVMKAFAMPLTPADVERERIGQMSARRDGTLPKYALQTQQSVKGHTFRITTQCIHEEKWKGQQDDEKDNGIGQ